MYNPEYCARPHVVALNKMDLQDAVQLQEEIASEVLTMARRIQVGARLSVDHCMQSMYHSGSAWLCTLCLTVAGCHHQTQCQCKVRFSAG